MLTPVIDVDFFQASQRKTLKYFQVLLSQVNPPQPLLFDIDKRSEERRVVTIKSTFKN